MYEEHDKALQRAFRDSNMMLPLVALNTAEMNDADHPLSGTEVFTLTVKFKIRAVGSTLLMDPR